MRYSRLLVPPLKAWHLLRFTLPFSFVQIIWCTVTVIVGSLCVAMAVFTINAMNGVILPAASLTASIVVPVLLATAVLAAVLIVLRFVYLRNVYNTIPRLRKVLNHRAYHDEEMDKWLVLPLVRRRKVALAAAGVNPEIAMNPETMRLTRDDLAILEHLSSETKTSVEEW